MYGFGKPLQLEEIRRRAMRYNVKEISMRMKLNLFGWVFDNNPEPAKLMVIYQDIKDFASSLKDWKARDCNILVAQPEHGQRRRYKCILNHLITQEWVWT
ncbi:hypothetical protein HID58_060580 [Brassica napus]|uniref:BnaC04g55080D protein n=3 Tax=Brassica TaxID=3705 RepID=A0A078J0U5_BRANA|nr:hypothetical protein HID58_060580 [Brassica napus]CAF1845413.1 unnamed protein product [Brassica napus]CDY58903.1 BnaC04g55080D [Brassica napus]VDD09323.1 unnamed protein product [Brassica oleracea]